VIILEGWALATWFGFMPHPHDDKGSMTARSFKVATWVLLFAVAGGLGTATGSAVAHDLTHAGHHSAGMHSTGICAWIARQARQLIPRRFPVCTMSHVIVVQDL
jgi:hypothetical protein